MKLIKRTIESRAYSEEEAKDFCETFRTRANEEGYMVGAAGYTYKSKKRKGEIVGEAWLCKCVEIHNDIWEEDE